MIWESPTGRLGSDLGTRPILVPAYGLMSQKLCVWGSYGEWTLAGGEGHTHAGACCVPRACFCCCVNSHTASGHRPASRMRVNFQQPIGVRGKPQCLASGSFHGVNTPVTADFKLPKSLHGTQSGQRSRWLRASPPHIVFTGKGKVRLG